MGGSVLFSNRTLEAISRLQLKTQQDASDEQYGTVTRIFGFDG